MFVLSEADMDCLFRAAVDGEVDNTACEQLSAKYPKLVALPNTTSYHEVNIEYWDLAAILSPLCIFTPENPQEVAGGLTVVRQTRTPFAIRSGGHTPIPGASGTSNGVLIASDNLRHIELGTSAGQQIVKVGPGLRWIEVYEWLANQSLTAIGGRYATVGVGGLSLGGGLSYYRSVHGWAADSIVNFELVTAQGDVLQVNKNSNADLFWALKGGSGNFGFVVSLELEVYPLVDIYGGNILTDAAGTDALVRASASYADPVLGGVADPLSAVNPTLQLDLYTRQRSSFTNIFYNASVNSSPDALKNFTSVPPVIPSTVTGPRSFVGFINETAAFPNDMR
ncbi:MAG: hypothetical protein L6R39_005663 [Caloplaca ligustica]|nr:MAG: hypothetical protein L6R39_005663 [Caloplaca ligustica]